MESKIVVKIEQHFEDGSVVDWTRAVDSEIADLGLNILGGKTTYSCQGLKMRLAEKVQEIILKSDNSIEV